MPTTVPSTFAAAAAAAVVLHRITSAMGREDGAGFRTLVPDASAEEIDTAAHAARAARRAGPDGQRDLDVVVYCQAFRAGAAG